MFCNNLKSRDAIVFVTRKEMEPDRNYSRDNKLKYIKKYSLLPKVNSFLLYLKCEEIFSFIPLFPTKIG